MSVGSLIEKVKGFFEDADAAKESESDRDGLLSYAGEWHALIIGLGCGVGLGVAGVALVSATALGLSGYERIKTKKAIRELKREPWYGIGGSVIGFGANYGLGIEGLELIPLLV